jgi:hypothetical protein
MQRSDANSIENIGLVKTKPKLKHWVRRIQYVIDFVLGREILNYGFQSQSIEAIKYI